MNSTFKGILIGVFASVLILVFAKILLNYENQPNPTTSIISNNQINVKSTLQDSENTNKQVNTNRQVKKTDNFSEATIKPIDSSEQQAKKEKIIALDNKYAQMERDLSEQILDLRLQLSNLPVELRKKLSYINNEDEVTRVSDEARKEAERIQKQILATNEKLTLIKAKRQLLPLTAISEK